MKKLKATTIVWIVLGVFVFLFFLNGSAAGGALQGAIKAFQDWFDGIVRAIQNGFPLP